MAKTENFYYKPGTLITKNDVDKRDMTRGASEPARGNTALSYLSARVEHQLLRVHGLYACRERERTCATVIQSNFTLFRMKLQR